MKKLVLFLLAIPVVSLLASVGLEVQDGILVQTNGGVVVEIDGNLTETGTGYFSGAVSSGSRTGLTAFAGLTISPGMNGTVVRKTGALYAKGNGEGTNFKRYFEIDNAGTGAVAGTMAIGYVGSGPNDETNGLAAPFFIYRYASGWTGYGSGVDASPNTSNDVEIPLGASDCVLSEGSRVAVRVFLEGPYNARTDRMASSIRAFIPRLSPYKEDARTASSIPTGATDWVLLQVRATAKGAVLASRSCFLRDDGRLVQDDGTTAYAGIKAPPGDYFLVLKHRNHLRVMSTKAVAGLTWGTTPSVPYDFSTGTDKYYGADAKLLETGVYGAYAGDANATGFITAKDHEAVHASMNASGYNSADTNLSGIVTNADREPIYSNLNKADPVP